MFFGPITVLGMFISFLSLVYYYGYYYLSYESAPRCVGPRPPSLGIFIFRSWQLCEKLAVSVRSRVTLSRWQRVPLAPLKPIEFVLGTSSRRLSLLSGY